MILLEISRVANMRQSARASWCCADKVRASWCCASSEEPRAALLEPRLEPNQGPALPHAPRTLWTFWDGPLPPFQQFSVQNFRASNPGWRVTLLNRSSALRLLGAHMLPRTLTTMTPQQASDAVRLAALVIFGGAYVDIGSLFLRRGALSSMYRQMMSRGAELRAYTLANARVNKTASEQVIENWFLMASPQSSIVKQWHAMFLLYFETKSRAHRILDHPLLQSIEAEGSAAMRRMNPDYLATYALWLAVSGLPEWRGGRWRSHVMTEPAMARGYLVQAHFCPIADGQCCVDAMFGARKATLSSGRSLLEALRSHTPLLKLNKNCHRPVAARFARGPPPRKSVIAELEYDTRLALRP
eukprot:3150025-Prymnesium_polylepis.1